jgi:hypothetical protein
MKAFLAAIRDELLQVVILLAVIGAVGYYAWRKLFGAQAPNDVAAAAVQGTKDIVNGLPSVVVSTLKGESEKTYMTDAQMREAAAEALAKTLAAKAAGG